jgi:hypothetical protein
MKNTAAKHFWDWFLKCQESFLHLPLLPKARKLYLLDELQVHLTGCCCQYIYAEIFYDGDCTRATMIITANGDPKRFKRIERLINKAPLLKGWQFQALYPPMPPDFRLKERYPDLAIAVEDIWFCPEELHREEDKYDLVLYVPPQVLISEEYREAMYSIVYNVLGERSAILDMRHIVVLHEQDFLPRGEEELIGLRFLPRYIHSQSYSAFQVMEGGGIVPR